MDAATGCAKQAREHTLSVRNSLDASAFQVKVHDFATVMDVCQDIAAEIGMEAGKRLVLMSGESS